MWEEQGKDAIGKGGNQKTTKRKSGKPKAKKSGANERAKHTKKTLNENLRKHQEPQKAQKPTRHKNKPQQSQNRTITKTLKTRTPTFNRPETAKHQQAEPDNRKTKKSPKALKRKSLKPKYLKSAGLLGIGKGNK